MNNFYSINNISKSFGNRRILDNISYTFLPGKMYAIIGKSGSGKTTLLNILGLLDNKFSGQLLINDKLISSKSRVEKIRNELIGFVFQSYFLIDYLNVKENILMPSLYYEKKIDPLKLDEEYYEIKSILDLSYLKDTDSVNYLSGGEKQRIAIARSLILNPQIIICDEPTGNLDDENAENVISLLKKIKGDNKILIIVTHSEKVAKSADCILELSGGNLYEKK